MKENIPDIIKKVGFDFDWDEKRVWALDVPITEMDIKELIWHFDIPFHWYGDGVYNLTSKEIIENPEKYKEEYERTMKADLKYPIDIMKNKDRWLILDGLHRLMRAYIQGLKIVQVRIIPRDKIPEILMEQKPKVIEISIPEYTIDSQPDHKSVGAKIDETIADNFEGTFLLRALSIIDHPQYTLDEFADIILKTGTDKYDPNRKGVAHEEFEPYRPDIQAGEIVIKDGKIVGESFSEDIRRFYENVLLDRGYRLRVDLIVLYDPEQLVQAEKIDHTKPSTEPHLEQYLWRFKDPDNKPRALVGIIKILK